MNRSAFKVVTDALMRIALFVVLIGVSACARTPVTPDAAPEMTAEAPAMPAMVEKDMGPPSPDPRVGLGAGLFDAEETIWNLRKLSTTFPPEAFVGVTNSDLAFKDNYAIQGNYNGVQVWDISNPTKPSLVKDFVCPASQSDVSVYGNLLFVSGEGLGGRLDCGTQGVEEAVSKDRLRGIRIFDITDIQNPDYVTNVQTCRGSHTHSVLKDPNDDDNVYVYVSGSAQVRPEEELPGCSSEMPEDDPNSALFRIEVIQVPLANPKMSKIISSPRIFEDLEAPPEHGLAPEEVAEVAKAKAEGGFVVDIQGQPRVLPDRFVMQLLGRMVSERGGEGEPTAADSSALREALPAMIAQMFGSGDGEQRGPNQCHDITLYPEIGLAGGACEGYGLLLDISDPINPTRLAAVADSNFSYWHSATFNNDGTKILFTDEWGGGGQPKCRATDPKEWGANAIFTLENRQMNFQTYYKLAPPQTSAENCVAHNGSLIPIPGRDVMVQSWYQGGISIFDWTDPMNPFEIAYHDRGPVNPDRMEMGGSWSVYWYNGLIVSSEIARGLDIFELTPSPYISANEIAAAKTVRHDYLNAQGQPMLKWPTTFSLAQAYVDQLERSKGLSMARITAVRQALSGAENMQGDAKKQALTRLASALEGEASGSSDAAKVRMLASVTRDLAAM